MANPEVKPPIEIKGGGKIIVLVAGRVNVTATTPNVIIKRID